MEEEEVDDDSHGPAGCPVQDHCRGDVARYWDHQTCQAVQNSSDNTGVSLQFLGLLFGCLGLHGGHEDGAGEGQSHHDGQ